MRYMPNPAAQAAGSLAGPMAILAAGVVESISGLGDSLAAHRQEREVHAYAEALRRSRQHAAELEAVARVSLAQVTELRLEVEALKRALAQRHEVIQTLRARA